MTARLVALDLPGGPGFVEVLLETWQNGDAAFPIDQRLPSKAKQALIEALRPSSVVSTHDRVDRSDGVPVLEGDALVVATSGTSGVPKGVVLTHQAVEWSARATSQALGANPSTDHWVAALPLAHIGGLSVVTRAVATGTKLTVLSQFDADEIAHANRCGANLLSLVPAALDRIEPSRWKVLLLGGSAMPSSLPSHAVRTYGLTETGSGVVYNGRPLEGVEIRIQGEEIFLRSPSLLRAYRGSDQQVSPEGSPAVDADGWFHTGDAGSIDNTGLLSVVGRMGDLINTGGEKVWPDQVERVLNQLPALSEVAVIGLPDLRWGHRVVAVVVPTPRSDTTIPTLDEIRAFVKAELPAYCAPQELLFRSSLPKTAIGKVQRQALASLIMAETEGPNPNH